MIATDYKSDNFWDVLDRLDEFGLSSNQFRIYCHLLKAAVDTVVSDESSESIARVCKLTRVTVIRVLSQLSNMGMIQCDRTPGKKTTFHLMPYPHWRRLGAQEKKQADTKQSKVVPLGVSDSGQSKSATRKPNLPVNEINTQQEAEESSIGDSSALLGHQPVNEIDLSTADTGSLDEKLAAARERGWMDTGTWWNDLAVIRWSK